MNTDLEPFEINSVLGTGAHLSQTITRTDKQDGLHHSRLITSVFTAHILENTILPACVR